MKTAYGRKRLRTLALALGTAALLAACFGGGGDDAPGYSFETADTPPDGTGGSTATVLAFINDLAGSPLEGREPFNIDSLTIPADNGDTQEPARTSIDQ
jgi:hypothetical protein